ncbi:MAG: hypothetical protein ACJ75B_16370 [Flavisolibacter sp.]
MKETTKNKWLFAFLLASPIAVFLLAYLLNHPPQLIPTGFIQYDNASYIAYAKQYLDADFFQWQYANPFHNGPAIYFQPQTLFFAALLKIGCPPGSILIPFTFFCSVVCFYLLISIYDLICAPGRFRVLQIWLLSWGGGLLILLSPLAHVYLKSSNSLYSDLFILDPESGWWGLNLGRALIFSCEAYYHALFLGCIYLILKRKWLPALVFVLLISLSQPFTGTELIGILLLWCLVELFVSRKEIPAWFYGGLLLIFLFHIYYYFFYLNQYADHQSVSEQYALPWRLGWYRALPAYCLVAALALFAMASDSFRNFFRNRNNRLFACWFVAAFLLANHEYFMKARQPIHFTRGYVWTSLFLLGLPALQRCCIWIQERMGRAVLALFALLFFLDNLVWISVHVLTQDKEPSARYINQDQKNLLSLLDQDSDNQTMVVSDDETVGYLSAVYTKGWPWYSHPYTTPFALEKKKAQEDFFSKAIISPEWKNRKVNFILLKTDSLAFHQLLTLPVEKIIKTGDFILFEYRPYK